MEQFQFACTYIVYDDRNLQLQESKYIPHIIPTFITSWVYIQCRTLQWNDQGLDKQDKADGVHKMLQQKRKYVPEYV